MNNSPAVRTDIRDVGVAYISVLVILKVLYELRGTLIGKGLWLLVPLTFFLVPLFLTRRRKETFESLGIHLRNVKSAISLSLKVLFLTFPPFVFLFWLWNRYVPMGSPLSMTPLAWVSVVVFHFFYVSIPEELFYRGYIQGKINRVYPPLLSVFGVKIGYGVPVSAVLFALGHFIINFHPFRLGVFFPSLIFGWMRDKTGGILAPAIYHALCNVLVILLEQVFL